MVLDSGDTAWMLVAGSLVLLMIPALGLFESGLLRKKNASSIFMQIFFGLSLLSVMWFVFGFSLSFGPSTMGLGGNLDWVFLKGVPSDAPLEQYAPTIPGVLFFKFQLMFAAITPLLLTGTIAERMKFSSFIIFISAWSMLIYYPLVHWVWVGWFGFNAGSALAASGGVAGNTVIVTHMASSVSALIWAGLSWVRTGKPSVVATINGAIAGLAGITPASGFVSAEHAFVIGIVIGVISYSGVVPFKEKLRIDDALDVSSVHGVAGIVGALAIGIFASTAINPAGVDGLLFGNPDQLWIQAIGIAVAGVMGFGGTWIILQIIKRLIEIRVSAEVEDIGLDISEHAESAYSDEEEFMLEMDKYTDDLQDKDEILFKKKSSGKKK